MGKIVKGLDLKNGDVILMGDQGQRDVHTTVVRTGALPPPDRFGRVLNAVWARREDTGAEGFVTFGDEGVFELAEGTE